MAIKRKARNYDKAPQSEPVAREVKLTLINGRPRLNHLLRSRCRVFFVVFAIRLCTCRHAGTGSATRIGK